jgi:hypothetical protein
VGAVADDVAVSAQYSVLQGNRIQGPIFFAMHVDHRTLRTHRMGPEINCTEFAIRTSEKGAGIVNPSVRLRG